MCNHNTSGILFVLGGGERGGGGGLSVHVVKPLNGENEGLKVVSATSQRNEFISVVLSSIHYVNIYFLS